MSAFAGGELAAKSEGASENVKAHAAHVTASLENVARWTDEAIAAARKLIAAKDVGGGQILVDELTGLIGQIAIGADANSDGQTGWETGEGGLRQANTHMRLMMKGEGLLVGRVEEWWESGSRGSRGVEESKSLRGGCSDCCAFHGSAA